VVACANVANLFMVRGESRQRELAVRGAIGAGLGGMVAQSFGEALVLAAKAGVDPAKVRQALLGGFAQSKILEAHGQKMLERNFKPGFRIRLHEKDIKIALAAGSEYGVPLMVTGVVGQMMTAMKGMGQGDLDHSGLIKFVEDLAKKQISDS